MSACMVVLITQTMAPIPQIYLQTLLLSTRGQSSEAQKVQVPNKQKILLNYALWDILRVLGSHQHAAL